MTNKLFLSSALMAASMTLAAQTTNADAEGAYRLADAKQMWHNTANAAGITADSTAVRGQAFFQLSHHDGDYWQAQQGNKGNELRFFTERYQKMGRYLYGYGSFAFDMSRSKNRAWSDVYRSYNSNPYFSGSSIKGRYDRQDITLKAALGTVAFGPMRYGFALDYQLGDLSRLRDPRSRSNLLDYRITPSAIYSFADGKNSIGLAAHYNRRKEKIPNIRTVQTDATMKYELFSGMENHIGTTGGFGGYEREWVNHEFGAELSYEHKAQNVRTLTTASIARGTEHTYGTYKYEPGTYYSYRYGVYSQNRLHTTGVIHQLDAKAQYTQAYADEYRQELVQETDAAHGYTSYRYDRTMTFKKRYQVMLLDIDINYRANFTSDNNTTTGYAGLSGAFQRCDNKHLLRYSELIRAKWTLNAEGGWAPLNNKRLWIDAIAGVRFAGRVDQHLDNPTTEYAQQVLIPDLEYYRANSFRARLQVSYLFPMRLKDVRSTWFVRAYTDYLHTNTHRHSRTFGITFGVYN